MLAIFWSMFLDNGLLTPGTVDQLSAFATVALHLSAHPYQLWSRWMLFAQLPVCFKIQPSRHPSTDANGPTCIPVEFEGYDQTDT